MTDRPALVASDLDGTLLRSDGTASARTVRAVQAIQDAGIAFVLATARPPRWLHDLLDVVGDHGVAICTNGAFVYDVANRQLMAERTIPREVITAIVIELREAFPKVAFAVERADGYGHEPHYDNLHPIPPGSPVGALEDLVDLPPAKVLARAPGIDEAEFLAEVQRIVGDRAVATYSGSGGLAEINAAGVTKAAVLAEWSAERGIDAADVWAFGDMPNDLPMLAWAGTSYAVANAHPEVAAMATRVCPSNDEDGVAQVLEAIVGGVSAAGGQSANG